MHTATYFSYKAVNNKNGRSIYGKVEAPNELALEQMLASSDMTLITAKKEKKSKLGEMLSFTNNINSKDLVTLFISMEQLQKAGVSILDLMKDLKDYTEKPKLKDILRDVYENLKNGDMLSQAMARHPKVFNEIMISLIEIGEKTGNLDRSFRNIYENIKWSLDISRKTVKAVKGPMFSLLMLFGVTTILLKSVVPKVLGFILEQEITIPGYTLALIATSDFIGKYFFVIIMTIVGVFLGIKFFRKANKKFRIYTDELKLKIPVVGQVIQKLEMSKFTKFFGVTFSSGIHILECITIANNVVQNAFLREEIEGIKKKVFDGKTVAKAISESTSFPFIVVRMFKVGEESGNIEEAMGNIAYFYESEINDSIDTMIGAIKPLILFVMGGVLCWVIAGVFGPIYGNFSNIV